MNVLMVHISKRFQLAMGMFGLVAFVWAALVFGSFFKPISHYELLSDANDVPAELRYALEWGDARDYIGQALTPGDRIVYGKLISSAMTGHLAKGAPHLIEDQPVARLGQGPLPVDLRLALRLQSRVVPKLQLQNRSLVVFEVETDQLFLRFDPTHHYILESRLEKISETVRIAETGRGMNVRQIELVSNPETLRPQPSSNFSRGSKLAGFNYYAKTASWDAFWTEFPVDTIRADFERMHNIGANSVRIFLTREAFDTPALRQRSLQRLEQLLDIAEGVEIQLIVTCFDLGVDYDLRVLARNWEHLQAILEVADGHPGLALIDLKNEPDLDYEVWGREHIQIWLSTLLILGQTAYPDLDFTIGWSSAEASHVLAEQVNTISFHDYLEPDTLPERVASIRALAGDKQVLVTEIGHSRWTPIPQSQSQAQLLERQLVALKDVDGFFVWTLNDFDHVPNSVAGWRPWRKAMQARYGLSASSTDLLTEFLGDFLSTNTVSRNGEFQ